MGRTWVGDGVLFGEGKGYVISRVCGKNSVRRGSESTLVRLLWELCDYFLEGVLVGVHRGCEQGRMAVVSPSVHFLYIFRE